MNILELLIIALGLAADAFAVSVCLGMPIRKLTVRQALIPGLYFGVFQGAMPLIGYLAGARFAEYIRDFDHWIAFGLLAFIGGKMVWGSFRPDKVPAEDSPTEGDAPRPLSPRRLLPLAVATSIDALAIGVSFAFLPDVNIIHAVLSIGVITFVLSAAGVAIGRVFGLRFKTVAERVGGFVLVLMGVKILIEHLTGQ
jgi:putative Mn2+ efflux pump MntP